MACPTFQAVQRMSSELQILQFSSELDPFMIQAIKKLETFCELLEDITNQTLQIQQGMEKNVTNANILTYVSNISNGQVDLLPNHQETPRQLVRYQIKTMKEALTLCQCASIFNKKLLVVVNKELQLKRSPEDYSNTLDREIKKLTELHAILNDFSVLIGKILSFYFGEDTEYVVDGFHTADELKNAHKKLSELKKSVKQNELHDLFSQYNADFITNETSILCATVGIDESFGEWIFKLDEDLRMHQTDLYYLEKILEHQAYELDAREESIGHGREVLMKNLHSLGFTTECCKTFVNNIQDDFIDLQSPLYWALRYLHTAFQNHPLLTEGARSRYIYQAEKIDTWFHEEIQRIGNETEAKIPVKMINISNISGKNEVIKLLKEQEDIETCKLFYHGTTHKGAKSIIKSGIIISRGSQCQDFSNGDGFYISEKFDNAKEWSQAARGKNQAVVVYRIKKQQLDSANGLDLMTLHQRWEEIISLCRNGYKKRGLYEKLLDGFDYIRGPICRNPLQVAKKSKVDGFCGDQDISVCIRSKVFADEFDSLSNILCVIFY